MIKVAFQLLIQRPRDRAPLRCRLPKPGSTDTGRTTRARPGRGRGPRQLPTEPATGRVAVLAAASVLLLTVAAATGACQCGLSPLTARGIRRVHTTALPLTAVALRTTAVALRAVAVLPGSGIARVGLVGQAAAVTIAPTRGRFRPTLSGVLQLALELVTGHRHGHPGTTTRSRAGGRGCGGRTAAAGRGSLRQLPVGRSGLPGTTPGAAPGRHP